MHSFTKPSRRAAIVACAAGVVVLGSVGAGAAAFADSAPTTGTSQAPAASAAPTGTPSDASTTGPDGGPAGGPGKGGPAGRPGKGGPAGMPHAPHIGGTVQSVDGSTVVVKDRDGFTRTIRLADDATVTKDGAASSTSAITEGEHIDATGAVDADGTTLDATTVSVGMPAGPKGGPAGKGGPGAQGGPARKDLAGKGGAAGKGAPTPPAAPTDGATPPAAPTDGATPPAAPTDGATPPAPTDDPAAAPTTGS